MKNFIFNLYNQLPNGYLRSVIKNIVSFFLSRLSEVETISHDGVKFNVYANPFISNSDIASDLEGYNRNYRLHKNDIVVDAGAYNGLFAIYAALKVGLKGHVYAFEPDPYSARMLSRNFHLNHLTNVTVIQKGLFSKKARVKFDVQGVGSRLQIYNRNIPTINSVVVVDTLDNMLADLKVKQINFIKMDIEGAEVEALKGCERTITYNRDIHFAIASYHIVHGKKTSHALERIFRSFGLRPETKNPPHLTTYADKYSSV
jgi:FkbM family methyltransferase